MHADELCVSYLALCFGYAIEFAGNDAFIDEFFIEPKQRGRAFAQSRANTIVFKNY